MNGIWLARILLFAIFIGIRTLCFSRRGYLDGLGRLEVLALVCTLIDWKMFLA